MATRRAWTRRSPQASKKNVGRRNVKTAEPPRTWRVVRGDKVGVVCGPEAGKVGNVIRVIRERGTVLVQGVRLRQRVIKEEGKDRQVTEYETPIHVSQVQLIDPSDGLPTKIRMGSDEDGKLVRISKRSGTAIAKPHYKDSEAGKKAHDHRIKYEDKFCDTSAVAASASTYRPSVLTFEEEVVASMKGLEIDWSRSAAVDVKDPLHTPHS
mmetsp:Transcript_21319/g.63522  ORF Transcript_21319/g.63522 Transcript_21319/m.63522 type:complete len:210 (+) Transcript_21319:258-887(+)